MEINLTDKKLVKLKLPHKEVMLRRPKIKEQLQLDADIKKAEESKSSMHEPLISMLLQLGDWTREDIVDMEMDDLMHIVSVLTGAKKN